MSKRFLALACLTAALTACGNEEPREPSGQAREPAAEGRPITAEARPSGEPRGVVLVLHGGAWKADPRGAVEQIRHYDGRFTAQGWVVVRVGYRPGEEGFADVTSAHDLARKRDPELPLCALGESAGGHLALMLAIERELDCVVGIAAPTDLANLSPGVRAAAIDAFGEDALARWSPAQRADEISAEVLLVQTPGDPLVPDSQGRALARALPSARVLELSPGNVPWIHSTSVSRESFRDYLSEEQAFLARAARK